MKEQDNEWNVLVLQTWSIWSQPIDGSAVITQNISAVDLTRIQAWIIMCKLILQAWVRLLKNWRKGLWHFFPIFKALSIELDHGVTRLHNGTSPKKVNIRLSAFI